MFDEEFYPTPKELIGKMVIRTEPVQYANGVKDYSYTESPITIIKVTDSHIVYKSNPDNDKDILNKRWIDDNWIEYEELVKEP